MITHSSLSHVHNDSGEDHHSHFLKKKENLHIQEIKMSFCIPKCFACKNEMQFAEGEIIHGEKWYHSSCWKDIEEVIELVTH